ncbi:MAG: DNA repair protein RadC [Proteobacteria bacterium]|nr:DNA repair protein RadC [Pseudomonadota bacterium]
MLRSGSAPSSRLVSTSTAASRERPRERLSRVGAAGLCTAELLALVLRTGVHGRDATALGRELLDHCDGLHGLAQSTEAELRRCSGLGRAKAASLVAALELGRRLLTRPLEPGRCVRDPADVHAHFGPRLAHATQESFFVMSLDARQRLLAEHRVSLGTLTASLVHPREVFRPALRQAAAAVLLVHNHPSGDPTPSAEDRDVTERLATAGRILGVRVLDHVIVGRDGYYSFAGAGELSDSPRGISGL